jgi:hypothetical protein
MFLGASMDRFYIWKPSKGFGSLLEIEFRRLKSDDLGGLPGKKTSGAPQMGAGLNPNGSRDVVPFQDHPLYGCRTRRTQFVSMDPILNCFGLRIVPRCFSPNLQLFYFFRKFKHHQALYSESFFSSIGT